MGSIHEQKIAKKTLWERTGLIRENRWVFFFIKNLNFLEPDLIKYRFYFKREPLLAPLVNIKTLKHKIFKSGII